MKIRKKVITRSPHFWRHVALFDRADLPHQEMFTKLGIDGDSKLLPFNEYTRFIFPVHWPITADLNPQSERESIDFISSD
jgi:hypothetical protein